MDEKVFHKNRIAFLIKDDGIKYLKDSTFSHLEWCRKLGISESEYENIVRGYVYMGDIVYYYGDFKYDERVIDTALATYEEIAKYAELKDYSVYCGVAKGKIGELWKPILKIK